jgi:hypothetical protein
MSARNASVLAYEVEPAPNGLNPRYLHDISVHLGETFAVLTVVNGHDWQKLGEELRRIVRYIAKRAGIECERSADRLSSAAMYAFVVQLDLIEHALEGNA